MRPLPLALLLVAIAATSASAAPQFVRVSWDDPDTAHTAVVTWNTEAADAPTIMEYGTSTAYDLAVQGTSFQANGVLGRVHEVSLADLKADTVYHYRVGGPGEWSTDYTFRTGPADGCSPFRFVALGDNRSDGLLPPEGPSLYWNPILTEALSHAPAFVLNTGDLVKDGDEDKQWFNFLTFTGDGIAGTPLMPSLGNHDDDKIEGDAASYNQLFSLPRNGVTGSEDYYYFTHGDAIFIALSTQTFKGGSSPFEEQAAWMDSVLTDNPATWKFVWFHHPIYTGVVGIPGLWELQHEANEQGQNGAFVPVFDDHHVDIVFNGHNHFYQRFKPTCCGGAASTGTVTDDHATGTTYVITGGAGALTYDVPFIDLADLLCLTPGSAECSGKHHFVMVEIDGLDLHYQAMTTAQQLLGSSEDNAKVIDEFWIHKEGPEPVCEGDEPVPVDEGPDEADAGVPDVPDDGSAPVDDAGVGPVDDATGDETGDATGDETGDANRDETGDETGDATGDETGDETTGETGDETTGDETTGDTGDETTGDTGQAPDAGSETGSGDKDAVGGGTGGGESGGTTGGSGAGGGESGGGSGDDMEDPGDGAGGQPSSGGCASVPAPGATPLAWLLALLTLALLRRTRAPRCRGGRA